MRIEIEVPESFTAHVRGVAFPVAPAGLPEVSLTKVFTYGLQRILNDAAASAKSDDEATGLAEKRWNNLCAGTLRASPIREGDPVRKRALELALAKVLANAKYTAWLAEAGLKPADKAAKAKARELAEAAITKPGNAFLAQAEKDVAEAKGLGDIDIEI